MTTGNRVRVLVVDDDEAMVVSLRDVLEASEYDVTTALSGEEAVEKVRQQAPDCVLMDIRMPGKNGVEAYRAIRELAPEAFVVFMTAYTASALVEEARQEGAIEVVSKPLDLNHVFGLIERTAVTRPVLVVDDDPVFNQSLSESLSAHDFDVLSAPDLDSAVAMFRNQPRRVVLLDMKLRERSGLEALMILKELNPRAIVILVTAFPELQSDMERGLSMSASAVFMKPFEVDELIGTIRELIETQTGGRSQDDG